MEKFISVLFAVGLFSSSSCYVMGQRFCSDKCIFECIQVLFDREYCLTCQAGDRATPVRLTPNETLAALLQHNHIYYDDLKGSLKSGCTDCSFEDNGGHIAYTKSIDLEKFFNLTEQYVVVRHDMKNEAFEWAVLLFLKIEKRFNHSDNYCLGELGLYEQYRKVDRFLPEENHEEYSHSKENTDTSLNGTDTDSEMTSTTPVPTDLITMKKDSTKSSSKPTKGPQTSRSGHHYIPSITIIMIIAGIICTILVISGIILRVVVNRRKRIQTRSSSRTYVFDSHN